MVLPHQYVDQQVRFETAAAAAEPAEIEEPECAWEAHYRIHGCPERSHSTKEEANLNYLEADKSVGKPFYIEQPRDDRSRHYQGKHPVFERLLVTPATVAEGESRNLGCLVEPKLPQPAHSQQARKGQADRRVRIWFLGVHFQKRPTPIFTFIAFLSGPFLITDLVFWGGCDH